MITLNDATWRFIRDHRTDDVRQLALMGVKTSEIDLPLALQQIQGWQTARTKLPSWAAKEEIVYPPHLNMEQCSSETTAEYKRDLVKRLCMVRKTMADLTGGMGIDFSTLAQDFDKAVYVERNPTLCALMAHNGPVLGLNHVEVRNEDCADVLAMLPQQDLIFMDPARRDHHGGRVFQLQDCQPDVLSLREKLLRKARVILLKLSPMLDWHAAVLRTGSAYCRNRQRMQRTATGLLVRTDRRWKRLLREQRATVLFSYGNDSQHRSKDKSRNPHRGLSL